MQQKSSYCPGITCPLLLLKQVDHSMTKILDFGGLLIGFEV
jgi:hypothetical protein